MPGGANEGSYPRLPSKTPEDLKNLTSCRVALIIYAVRIVIYSYRISIVADHVELSYGRNPLPAPRQPLCPAGTVGGANSCTRTRNTYT